MFQLKWLWKYMGKKRHLFVIALIISALSTGMIIINPMLSRKLIDEVILPNDPTLLIPILLTMIAVQFVRLGARYILTIMLEKNSLQMCDDVRARIYKVIEHQDFRFFSKVRTGDLMTRMTNDLDMLRHALAWISKVAVDSFVLFTFTLGFLFTVNVKLALALFTVTPLIFLVTYFFSKIIHPMFVRLRMKLSNLNTVAQENIEGNRVVKAFAKEEFEKEKFDEKNEEFRKQNLAATYVGVKFQPFIDFLSQSLTFITILVGGLLMINNELTPGEMLAFTSLTWALAAPLRQLGMVINDTNRFSASASMIIELFYSEPSIVDKEKTVEVKDRIKGDVEFNNVSFKINNKLVLEDINVKIKAGNTLGIMGTTGSGKTSFISILNRSYEPTVGNITLDGHDISDYKLSDLKRSMGIALQDVFLFSDTVDGNIAYSKPDMTHEEIVKFAKIADADSFINGMSEGYDTIVGERGVGLSGGQKQRISLARALATKPSILILDDTTSAVDMETEQYIQSQLRELEFDCTKIIVAQRVSSVQKADEIIFMDEGRIVERGTHKELIRQKGHYYNIWALQNNIEEDGEING